MAEAEANGLKRSHPPDDAPNGDNAQKRIRTPNGSPAPQSLKPDPSKLKLDVRARLEAAKARIQGIKGLNGASPGPPSPAAAAPPPPTTKAPTSRLEEMRARVAALTGRSAAQPQQSTPSPVSTHQPSVYDDGSSRARGGLSAALHPSLLESSSSAPSKSGKSGVSQRNQPANSHAPKSNKAKKQLDLSGPSQEEIRQNPYVDTSIATTMRNRNPKQLKFLEKGKYIAQAAAIRRQTQLEEMKKRIAMQSRKVGISEDPSEKNFLIEAPPEMEWWDESLVVNPSDGYASAVKIDAEDSAITRLEVHPVSIAKPQNAVELKAMYLTSREQAKLRRQRRMADLKEHQMKVRLGMEPPDPPKVKRGNMMRVLGEEAVKDPTAVEARVNREIAERAQHHTDMNEERKLSKEARHEKVEAQKAADVSHGVILTVFKIDSLANGAHFFKVQKNMEQIGGVGLILSSPKFTLVLCEAGQRGTQLYKKLILNRIDWTENTPSRHNSRDTDSSNPKPKSKSSSSSTASAHWLQAEEIDPDTNAPLASGQLKDLSGNKAQLVFEGEERAAVFRKVMARACETDKEALELLERTKMGSFWTLARSLP